MNGVTLRSIGVNYLVRHSQSHCTTTQDNTPAWKSFFARPSIKTLNWVFFALNYSKGWAMKSEMHSIGSHCLESELYRTLRCYKWVDMLRNASNSSEYRSGIQMSRITQIRSHFSKFDVKSEILKPKNRFYIQFICCPINRYIVTFGSTLITDNNKTIVSLNKLFANEKSHWFGVWVRYWMAGLTSHFGPLLIGLANLLF